MTATIETVLLLITLAFAVETTILSENNSDPTTVCDIFDPWGNKLPPP
jgi:hypothetical protein